MNFERLVEALPEAYLLVDRAGVVRAANPAAARLVGAVPERMVGRPLVDWVTDPEAAVVELLRMSARSRTPLPGALTLRTAVGGTLACRCESAGLQPTTPTEEALVWLRLLEKAGSAQQFVVLNERIEALAREVGRRRVAESTLQDYSERLHVTLKSMGDAMIATDLQGRVTMMNGVAETLTGWSEAEAVGRAIDSIFVILNQHTRLPVDSPVTKVLRDGVVVGLANHTVLIARDGTERAIDDSGAPIRDSSGALAGVVLLFRDITERYAMEQALQQRTSALVESDRRKDEFLSMLAHELRNPLAPLQNGVHLLASGRLGEPDVGKTVQMLQRQLKHLTRLVDDLLDVARLNHGRIELRKAPIDVREIAEQALEMARPAMHSRQQHLAWTLPASPVVLEGDLARLVQVLTNLLTNAVKFTPQHGRIGLGIDVEGAEVVVTVSDDGIGIEPALLPKVFDMFVQADGSLDRSQGGLGIGLFVVRAIVEMHLGSVKACSEGPGCGSRFVVRLPLLSTPAVPFAR